MDSFTIHLTIHPFDTHLNISSLPPSPPLPYLCNHQALPSARRAGASSKSRRTRASRPSTLTVRLVVSPGMVVGLILLPPRTYYHLLPTVTSYLPVTYYHLSPSPTITCYHLLSPTRYPLPTTPPQARRVASPWWALTPPPCRPPVRRWNCSKRDMCSRSTRSNI